MAYSWGWSRNKFFNSTLEYFYKTWLGKELEYEKKQRAEWERLRMLGMWVLSPYSKNLTPNKLIQFPWDKPKGKQAFLEENKHLIPLWDKLSK